MPLDHFARRFEGAGRVTLTTLHSAKGRELDAVVMYGVNAADMPNVSRTRLTNPRCSLRSLNVLRAFIASNGGSPVNRPFNCGLLSSYHSSSLQ